VYAAGGATTMWVDYQRRKAKDLPDWLRALVTP
jgi:acyl-CoA thioester hydrolase